MKIAVFGSPFRKGFDEKIISLFRMMRERKMEVIIHKGFYEFLSGELSFTPGVEGMFENGQDISGRADYLFSIGGDGTFLETVSIVREHDIPVIGINTGRLGFLANVSPEQIESSLDALMEGDIVTEERSLIQVDYANGSYKGFNYALNEVTIQKELSYMITIHTFLDGSYLNSFWADGLIVATPTGSTAYSMSMGGPIITPDCSTLIISPMASHNLSNRPVVVPDSSIIRLRAEAREKQVILTMDSRSVLHPAGREILIRKADITLKTVRLKNNTFYDTLRNKLMWGADRRIGRGNPGA